MLTFLFLLTRNIRLNCITFAILFATIAGKCAPSVDFVAPPLDTYGPITGHVSGLAAPSTYEVILLDSQSNKIWWDKTHNVHGIPIADDGRFSVASSADEKGWINNTNVLKAPFIGVWIVSTNFGKLSVEGIPLPSQNMITLKVQRPFVCPAPFSRLSWGNLSLSGSYVAGYLYPLHPGSGTVARAQLPTNQLHFTFTDAPGGTTTHSDTSLDPNAIVTTVTMYNALQPGLNPVNSCMAQFGSGVANPGAVSITRALDFTSDIISSQTNQPANSKQVPPGQPFERER